MSSASPENCSQSARPEKPGPSREESSSYTHRRKINSLCLAPLSVVKATGSRERNDDQLGGRPQPVGTAAVLWRDELQELGKRRVEALSALCAVGLTAGEKSKSWSHTDPNEDGIAAIERDDRALLVCADGHNGVASTRAAIDVVLSQLGSVPAPGSIADENLVELWFTANLRVIDAGRKAGQPESRTTLIVALVDSDGVMRWAAMGDSLLAIVGPDGLVRRLGRPRSEFVGWPMTPEEVADRLQRGHEQLPDGAWVIAASDGLTDFVPDIDRALARAADGLDASSVVARLLAAACAGGAGDNVAVAAFRVPSVGSRRFATSPPSSTDTVASRPPTVIQRCARCRGSLLGLAAGDALGTTLEFTAPGQFDPVTDMVGGGPFALAPGQWTDDTSMALCWPRASSTAAGSIRSTSSAATSAGGATGISAPRAIALTSAARLVRRSQGFNAPARCSR
jgi:hypothetical protein